MNIEVITLCGQGLCMEEADGAVLLEPNFRSHFCREHLDEFEKKAQREGFVEGRDYVIERRQPKEHPS